MIVTLMVNNACNLRCQHCYLPAGLSNRLLPEKVIDWIFESQHLDGVILVGMEPLMNASVARVSEGIGRRCETRDIPFSIITNGMTLAKPFTEPVLRSIAATGGVIDISLDGGSAMYDRRGGNYERIINGLRHALDQHLKLQVCVLHTIWQGWDTERVDDSVAVLDTIPQIHRIQYSLYVNVDRIPDARADSLSAMTAQQAMVLLQTSPRFMNENRCVFVLDEYNARAEAVSLSHIKHMASANKFPFRRNFGKDSYKGHLIVAGDPIDNDGYMRVHPAAEGPIMLSPWDSLHTARYSEFGVLCNLSQPFDNAAQDVIQKYRSRYPSKT